MPADPDQMRGIVMLLGERAETADDPIERARMLGLRGVYLRILGDLDAAEEDLTIAGALARGARDERLAMAMLLRLAHVLQWQQRFESSTELFAMAVDLCERTPGLATLLDYAYQHAGKNLFDQGRYGEALAHFERALELREMLLSQGLNDDAPVRSTTLSEAMDLVASSVTAIEETKRRMNAEL